MTGAVVGLWLVVCGFRLDFGIWRYAQSQGEKEFVRGL
jgi:hypothetical protein